MKLTPEDREKLQTKALANVIRKLNAGGTLTAREDAMLATASSGEASGGSGYAKNWDELAKRLDVSRRAIQDWRGREDLRDKLPKARPDGRHDVAAWSRAMVQHGLARADEEDESPAGTSVAEWKRRREALGFAMDEIRLGKIKDELVEVAELEVAIGQMLAGFGAALSAFPSSTARFLVGLRTVHDVQAKLAAEVQMVMRRIHAARYLEDCLTAEVEALGLVEPHREIVQAACTAVLRAVGRRAVEDATGEREGDPAAVDAEAPPAAVEASASPSGAGGSSPGITLRPAKPKAKAKRLRPEKPKK